VGGRRLVPHGVPTHRSAWHQMPTFSASSIGTGSRAASW
jgi:hypothetical protein